MHSIVSSGNDVKGSEKRRTPSVLLFKGNLNASRLCFLHIKKRSVLCSVPFNIRTDATDARKGTYYEKSKKNKRKKK